MACFQNRVLLAMILGLALLAPGSAGAQTSGAAAGGGNEKSSSEKPTGDKAAGDKPSADKPAADKPGDDHPPADPTPAKGPDGAAAPAANVSLPSEQAKLAGKYKELERVILRMAEVMQASDPKRAALLRQAFAQSKEKQIDSQYEDLVKLLQQEQLYQASKGQAAMQQDLDQLLQLLLSGERDKQIPNERAEIKRFIERINKLIREEQGIQGETEGQGDADDLIKQQENVANKTGELTQDLNKFNALNHPAGGASDKPGDQGNEKSDEKNADGKNPDGKNADGKNSDEKNGDDKNSDSKKSGEEKSNEKAGSPLGQGEKQDGATEGEKSGDKSADASGQKGVPAGQKSDGKSGEQKADAQKSGAQKSGDQKSENQQPGDQQSQQKPGGQKSGNQKSGDQKSNAQKSDQQPPQKSDGEKSDQQKSDQQKSDQPSGGQSDQPSHDKSQQGGQGKQSKAQNGQPNDNDNDADKQNNSDQQQSDNDDTPARKRVQQAENRMRAAKRQLEQAQRRGAADQQQRAVEELKQAKAELEEILRQLREEEIERVLAQLEGRFRKMLEMQIEVYEGTIALDRTAEEDRDRDTEMEAGKLGRKEADITGEADKALALLHEEGSSVAFPETVEQMREDMDQVKTRLDRANIGQITQGIEQDIVKSLEEMVAALQKAQKDQQQRQGGAGGGGGGGQQDQPLVDAIAELKMIRALQMRVNTRTERYSKLLQDGAEQAEAPDLLEAVKRLSEREQRIYQTTRDIVVGKNK
ncbi:MAG TPA: hypothetical protein VMJ32_13085 [Pirellulales bacterium]|nr:hypothetical protein [Pirellulales bacterium]